MAMTKAVFKHRQTVYDRAGAKYEFEESLSGERALVRPIMAVDGYEGLEEYPSDAPTIVYLNAIFAKPPLASIDADIAAASARLAEINEALTDAECALNAKQREVLARIEKLQAFDGLQRIEDYIDGKMTHFVVQSGYQQNSVRIMEADELLNSKNDRGYSNGDTKLLCLFGTTQSYGQPKERRTVEWRLNQYYDGSGSWTKVVPATSHEEAVTIAHEHLQAIFDGYFAEEPGKRRTYLLEEAIRSSVALGFFVPPEAEKAAHALKVETARKQSEEASAKALEARQRFDALIAGESSCA
ncbi:MAG: hypothetical protein J0H81_00580 [Sphingopyxis terrae]|nr:hypothetical protein [Sphingopyxis terrae]